jgi:hypothetical protein
MIREELLDNVGAPSVALAVERMNDLQCQSPVALFGTLTAALTGIGKKPLEANCVRVLLREVIQQPL